jgi:hypothetical protein
MAGIFDSAIFDPAVFDCDDPLDTIRNRRRRRTDPNRDYQYVAITGKLRTR